MTGKLKKKNQFIVIVRQRVNIFRKYFHYLVLNTLTIWFEATNIH